MTHVELDCTVRFDPIHYDTFMLRHQGGRFRLEYDANRRTGPFFAGQWCTQFRVSDTSLRHDDDWDWVQPADTSRGQFWKRPTSEMDGYWLSGTPIWHDMLIFRRERGRGDLDELIGCGRDTWNGHVERVTVPLSDENGVLEGYVGCVS